MYSLRPTDCHRPRVLSGKSLAAAALIVAVLSGPFISAGAPPSLSKVRGKAGPRGAALPSAEIPQAPELEQFADAFPSELRPPAPDLLLSRQMERKAEGLAAFAQAIVAEDNADADEALAGYRKTIEVDPSYAELAIKVAYELARRNDVSGGIQVLKDTIKAAPKEPLPLVYLSQLYSKHLKKTDLALKYAEQAVALAPDNFACYLALYELHVAAGQPQKAAQILERAAKVGTSEPKFWVHLGDLYTRLYLNEDGTSQPEALGKMNAVYRKAAELGHDDAPTVAKVGDYFVLSRQVKAAIPFYLAALSLKSDSTELPVNNLREKLARAFRVTQQRDEAIAILEQITKEKPTQFETFELLGELYDEKGEVEKAISHYEQSLLLDGSQPQHYLRLADMLIRPEPRAPGELRQKRFDRAVETMRTARTRFPDRPDITFSLGLTLTQAKRYPEAMAVLAEAKAEAENNQAELLNATFYFQYGAAAEQAGLIEKAAELLKQCIALDPQYAEAYNYLGYMWVDRGENLDEAGEMIKKAVEMSPKKAAFMDSLGWYYFKKGEHQKALGELLRAAENIQIEDAVVFDHIGDAYHALGKPAEALNYWRKALALEQGNKKIEEKVETVKQKVTSKAPAAP